LVRAGEYEEAAKQLEIAKSRIDDTTSPLAKRNIRQDEILLALYEPSPTGFEKAIGMIEQLDEKSRSAAVEIYLAAAYGQKYAYDRDKLKAAEDVLKSDRDHALNAVRRALQLDSASKVTLQFLWNPKDESKMKDESLAIEDDLEDFFNDPDFKALLG